ncbi:hypothetical protein ACSZMU_07545 [Aeromonas caviae]
MRDDDMTLPEESAFEDLQTKLIAQVLASNQLRVHRNERLQALTEQVHVLSQELTDVNRRLVEEGEAHGHAIQVVEQITEQFNTLSKQYSDTLEELHLRDKKIKECDELLNKIRNNRILNFYIRRFI